MDRLSLNSYIPFVSSVGATLPAFQIATISTSLSSLVKTARLHDIQFFGRIDGATGDYLLAVSHEVDLFAPRKVFCSVDEGLSWAQLPSPVADAVLAEKILKLQTPFTGSLAQESVIDHEETVVPESSPVPEKVESPVAEEEKTGEEEEEEEEEEEKEAEAEEEEEEDVDDDDMKGKVVISEEVRLSTVVLHITQQYGLVPRGGCILNSEHFVLKNRLFRGLEPEEAEKWGSYLHFRNAERSEDTRLNSSHIPLSRMPSSA
eukprot:TRINITY_DN109_c0_g1_i1.p1 TRINITY_DN109_c0_g1~~TRINITY_DN109_c0_g1_i1.p1  ORF type:complete len:261 (+),score=83.63 TRINITY_DN109_c0_g1_i1:100-882(+)